MHATYIFFIGFRAFHFRNKENRKKQKLNAFAKQNLNMFSAKLHSDEALVSHGVLQLGRVICSLKPDIESIF